MMPSGGDMSKDRKVEQKVDMKKKTQAEIEQEMAALQYTNPMLLEVRATAPHCNSYTVSIASWTSTQSHRHAAHRTYTYDMHGPLVHCNVEVVSLA